MPKSISERKGVIRISDCLEYEDLKEMELYLKQKYNVIKINRLSRLDGQKMVPTSSLIVYFNGNMPDKNFYGPLSFRVRQWIPKSRKCLKCHLYEHTIEFCRSADIICGKCTSKGHDSMN